MTSRPDWKHGDRVTRSAKHLRATRHLARIDTNPGGLIVGGDGGHGTVVGPVPGCPTLVFVLWDDSPDCTARGIAASALIRVGDVHLDAMRAEHNRRVAP